MKKLIALVLALACVLGLIGCSKNFEDKPTVIGSIKEIYDNHILIATSTTEGHPYGASIDISISTKDCKEIYNPLTVGDEIIVYYDGNIAESEPAQINTVYAIKLKVKASEGYFDSGSDLAAQFPHFMAKILEIHDNYLLVEPEVGMEELKSADKFEIPLDDVDNPTELQVDDSILIVYDGEILETYPAKLGEVYSVGKMIIIPVDNSEESN